MPPQEPPPPSTPASKPKRQASLSALWGGTTPASEKPDSTPGSDKQGGTPSTQPSTHKKIKSKMTPDQVQAFEASLKEQTDAKRKAEEDRKAQLENTKKRKKDDGKGLLLDPDERHQGVARIQGAISGRPEGSLRAYKGSHKPAQAPVLRRDLSAAAKLKVVAIWDQALKNEEVESYNALAKSTKTNLQGMWRWSIEHVTKWKQQQSILESYIAKMRLSENGNGLRACGSYKVKVPRTSAKATGARIHMDMNGQASKRRPCEGVFGRLESWFKKERTYGHEVRRGTIVRRLVAELKYEKDKMEFLRDRKHKGFVPETLAYVVNKLKRLTADNVKDTNDDRWIRDTVMPRIGARARKGQKLKEKSNRKLDAVKALLTWATADRVFDVVARGSEEELSVFVRDTDEFAENRKDTSVVVVDQTALWLKLRGEDSVYVHTTELEANKSYRRVKAKFKAWKKSREDKDRQEFEAEKNAFCAKNPDHKAQIEAVYSSAGDKYRLTLVNISGVKNWFDPTKSPEAYKGRSILLVPCASHCKLSDMDLAEERGGDTWNKTVKYPRNDGSEQVFTQGEPVGRLLEAWRAAMRSFEPDEREWITKEIDVWGQPKAWSDELVSSWVIDAIREEYGQSVAFADCLSSQWSEPILTRAFLRGVVWTPMAPDVTPFLQEPDTHEHSQLKAELRRVKAELHDTLEAEYNKVCKEAPSDAQPEYPSRWGPRECLFVVAEGMKRFKKSHKGKVPLEGMQACQMLAVRPTGPDNKLELVTGEEPWSFSTEPGRGISYTLARDRAKCVEAWPDGRAPLPDWTKLDGACLVEDDLPRDAEDEDDEFAMDIEGLALELGDEQIKMLVKPEDREVSPAFPQALLKRLETSKKLPRTRKNRWGAKFAGHFMGKFHAKRLGKSREQLENESTGVAKVGKKPTQKHSKLSARGRQRGKANQNSKMAKRRGGSEVQDTEYNHAFVRVAADTVHEGRHGQVVTVRKTEGKDGYDLTILGDEGSGVFHCASTEVVFEKKDWNKSAPSKLDWRRLPDTRRALLGKDLAILNCDLVVEGENMEIGTVESCLREIQLRLGGVDEENWPKNVLLVPPSVAELWGHGVEGEAEENPERRDAQAEWYKKVEASKLFYIVLHSAPPSHYTYLQVRKYDEDDSFEIVYKDSLREPSEAGLAKATSILRKLGALKEDEHCPQPSNQCFQKDGWSCGLWATRWVERSLREMRGEAREPPVSLRDLRTRANEFIANLKKASDNPKAKGKAKAKPKPDASSKPATKKPFVWELPEKPPDPCEPEDASKPQDPPETKKPEDTSKPKGPSESKKPVEAGEKAASHPRDPEWATIEEAMLAATLHSKCHHKGCRGCMGVHFESIRKKGFMARAQKDLQLASETDN